MCGEKLPSMSYSVVRFGSPPRMRGKGVVNVLVSEPFRITPACAGKSPQRAHCSPVPWDHPCVCGEKIEMPYELLLKEGSPPRMRGKGVVDVLVSEPLGITPACAGKSSLMLLWSGPLRDHPRVCGEKAYSRVIIGSLWGSPPRMRGKAVHHKHRHSPGRITPACAGKREKTPLGSGASWDHPRVCEEKVMSAIALWYAVGSPPHVRGKVCSGL